MQRRIREAVKNVFDRRKITDHGPIEFKTHKARQESEILSIASRKPITVTKTMPIKQATEIMINFGVRRVPVVDAGTKRLLGVLTSMDVLDLLGGGEKYNITKGNLYRIMNYPVGKIMTTKVKSISEEDTISKTISFFLKTEVGGAPIIDSHDRVVGIVTQRDLMRLISGTITGIKVRDQMRKPITATPGMLVGDVAKVMLRNKYRRLPVVEEDRLRGMITAMDIIRATATSKIFDPNLRANDIMTKKVVATTPDIDIGKIAENIDRKGIGAFPVLENNRLVGVITEFDVLRAFGR